MKNFFLWAAWMCCSIFISKAQSPEIINRYQSVFIAPLLYEKSKSDIYGIRQTVVEKLSACGVPLFKDEQSIPSSTMKNPCTMLHCLVNNAASPGEKGFSLVSVLFLTCSNDTVLSFFAKAKVFPVFRDTRNSFIAATQKALEILDHYQYQFAEPSITIAPPVITDNDSIQWDPGRKLSWDDFKGTAKDNDPADALTYTANATFFESYGVGNRFEVESHITCYFIKSKSWVRAEKKSDYLLNHEQRHFDISEIGAREFRKKLKKAAFKKENFHKEVKRLTEEVNNKFHSLQEQYDSETNHSRVEEKQEEWNKKIDGMLKDSEEYR